MAKYREGWKQCSKSFVYNPAAWRCKPYGTGSCVGGEMVVASLGATPSDVLQEVEDSANSPS